jgi:ferredoxin
VFLEELLAAVPTGSIGCCVEALPEVFRIDEEGKSVVLEGVASADEPESVVDDCPNGAINLEARPQA